MKKFHMLKVKPFIHILSNFHEFLSTPTPPAAAVNWSGSEARFEETQDQLSPRHFTNTGSNLLFNVECSYLVNIKPNHSRICWYKNIYSPKHFSPTCVSGSGGGVFQSFPKQRFLPKHLQASEPDRFDWHLQHIMCWCQHKYSTDQSKVIRRAGKSLIASYLP